MTYLTQLSPPPTAHARRGAITVEIAKRSNISGRRRHLCLTWYDIVNERQVWSDNLRTMFVSAAWGTKWPFCCRGSIWLIITTSPGGSLDVSIDQWTNLYIFVYTPYRSHNAIDHTTRGATTFSKLGVQFVRLWYYYPFTEKHILDMSTQFGAVGSIFTLYSSKSYAKRWGSIQILGRSEPPTPQWLRPCTPWTRTIQDCLVRVRGVD